MESSRHQYMLTTRPPLPTECEASAMGAVLSTIFHSDFNPISGGRTFTVITTATNRFICFVTGHSIVCQRKYSMKQHAHQHFGHASFL